MKECQICGTLNFKKNTYCTHCGCMIVEENICQYCGVKNPDTSTVCINCNRPIDPVAIEDFEDLFNIFNVKLLVDSKFTIADYNSILNNMFKKLDYMNIDGKTPKDKVLQIANVFTIVVPKSSGVVNGEYGSPIIFYDDRLDESLQISTIIHELAHFLLFDFSVNILCNIFDVKSSSVVKSFVEYFLTLDEMRIINEFYAHTVENRFIPLKYQSFNSFKHCVFSSGMTTNDVWQEMELGFTMAYDIIRHLEKYIDENLRQSIKLQFKMDMVDSKNSIDFDSPKVLLDDDKKIEVFIGLMAYHFYYLYNNEEARKELEPIKNRFEFK